MLCVPTFAYNLLSVSKLLPDSTHQVIFLADNCYIQYHSWKKVLELDKEDQGLYILIYTTSQQNCSFINNVAFTVKSETKVASTVKSETKQLHLSDSHFSAQASSLDVWHAMLGHFLVHTVNLLHVNSSSKSLDICDSCHFAKQSRLSFPMSNHKSYHLFVLVHADLWGPY